MVDLDGARWRELQHGDARASDIPVMLAQLQNLPGAGNNAEPCFSIWGALAHQGGVYSASFAAVPHVIAALAQQPAEAGDAFFHFPA